MIDKHVIARLRTYRERPYGGVEHDIAAALDRLEELEWIVSMIRAKDAGGHGVDLGQMSHPERLKLLA